MELQLSFASLAGSICLHVRFDSGCISTAPGISSIGCLMETARLGLRWFQEGFVCSLFYRGTAGRHYDRKHLFVCLRLASDAYL